MADQPRVGGDQAQEVPSLGRDKQPRGTAKLGVPKTKEGGPQPGGTKPRGFGQGFKTILSIIIP